MSVRCSFKKATHVIFDMDGILLDTERLYTVAYQKIVSRYGKTFDWSLKIKLMGLHGKEAAKTVVDLLQLPLTWDEFYKMVQQEYTIIMPDCQLMPDSEGVYRLAITTIAKRFGKIYTPEIMAKVVGTPESESARIAVTEMQLPIAIKKFQYEFRDLAHKHFFRHGVPLMPGAETLVKHLHKSNVPIAVATSSSDNSFELKTKKHKQFFSLFHHIVCGGSDPEVSAGKPNPDIFLVCASRFSDKPSPENCLVVEDAPNGVTAAIRAGMQVVMVPDENVPEELQKHAHVKVNSLENLPLEKFGLPALKV